MKTPEQIASDIVCEYGGHGLNVAHCVASCPEPTSCTCEEITHFTPHQLVDAYCIVLEYAQFCCPVLDNFCAQDADLVLQIALYQEIVFG